MKTPLQANTLADIDHRMNWEFLPVLADWTIAQSISLQQIPAPTFHESARAKFVAAQFRELGLKQVSIDDVYNVYGILPGSNPALPALMVTAHTDTVFPAETDLDIRREGDLIYGPGLGDNSLGVGGMLALARTLSALPSEFALERSVWFVATTGEEGLGDLRGMKAAFATLKEDIGAVINLEGMALGHVYHIGIAVRRLHIIAHAAGGHSWLHFGRPSAIHTLMRLGAEITQIVPTALPRTTYNIGMIDGGTAINALASKASLWLDLRSESADELHALEGQVRAIIDRYNAEVSQVTLEVVGDRPAGRIDPNHPLVGLALGALAQVNLRGALESGSTDGNVPLTHGIPTVTIGISSGGNAHRLDEFIEISPVEKGLHQLILLTLACDHLALSGSGS
ncbi:MAG: M20/M25/M40 family metallo-hydrolase [Pleurocapsa minor GSE-CHR-MK-17-07R]|nr:M20/M25/M40 family metallo-hydrolase [Pleurocapsa minor GSE-CHR-MK 17-07R]